MLARRDIQTCQEAVKLLLQKPVRALAMVQDLKSFRRHVGNLSQGELGELMGFYRMNGRVGAPYTRQAVSAWELGTHSLTDEPRACLARIVEAGLPAGLSVRAKFGPGAWRFEAIAACARCGRPFVLERSRDKRCRRCRAKRMAP